jgi:hypothetical protein
LGQHLVEVNSGIGLSDCLWIGDRVHRIYMVAAAVSACTGGDAHLRESSGGCIFRMAARIRTADHASGAGVGGNPGSDRVNPQRRAKSSAAPGKPQLCESQID